MLGRKKNNSNEDWLRAFDISDRLYTKGQMEDRLGTAAEALKAKTAGKTCVCCWSGGKDAQVVRLICEMAGVKTFVMGSAGELEYPAFRKWVDAEKPDGLEIYEAGIDHGVFTKRKNLVFPDNAADAYWYYVNVNQQAWKKGAEKHGADALILGHRELDGNQKGKPFTINGKTIEKVFPIWSFNHEEIFAAIKHFSLPLAPFYSWPDGFTEGTHVTLGRSGKRGRRETAAQIMRIDDSILPRLAKTIPVIYDYI